MATKLDTRQSVNRSALSMIGSAANESLASILAKIDPELSKLFEDRNILLTDGGLITFTGTQLQFTEALKISVNSKVAGGSPVVIDLASTTRTLSVSGRMLYAVIDRGAGTAVVTDDSATLPAVTSANQEVFLIAKRVDATDGTKRVYFRNGMALDEGQTVRLGSSGSGSGSGGTGDDINTLNFKASFGDSFDDKKAINSGAGFTDDTLYSAGKKLYRLSYDATKTVTGVGTAMTLSGAPTFTIKAGDVLRVGTEVRRITGITSQTVFAIESAFTVDPSASACTIAQAVHTVDIASFNDSGNGLALNSIFTDSIASYLISYRDSAAADDVVLDNGTPALMGFVASTDNSAWSEVGTRPDALSSDLSKRITATEGTSFYLRFFPNATSGSGAANILDYKVYLYEVEASQSGSVAYKALARTDGAGTEVNCSVSSDSGKTRITTTFAFGSEIEVYLDGKRLPEFVDITLTPDGYFKRITGNIVELDSNYSGSGLQVEIIIPANTIDNTEANSAKIADLQDMSTAGFQGFVDESAKLSAINGAPSAGQFRTFGIKNRASISDLANDLRARMGIDRIPIQQIVELQNEFGPAGERVYKALNDDRDLIRFVGDYWTTPTNINFGTRVNTGLNTTDYMEVVFYGTGLNILTLADNSAVSLDARATVDGGAEGGNIYSSSTMSALLGNRNYNTNQVVSVASGLSLGLHTVKIRNNTGTGYLNIYGIEILNEASAVKVNPGIAYANGKKLVNSAIQTLAYNSGFESILRDGGNVGSLSTRGARVLVYQKSDGTIAKAAVEVDSIQRNLGSADHTNEEVSRVYNFREFGAGRSDDFSVNFPAASTLSFTLEDGTTTLSCIGASADVPGFPGMQANTATTTFTFTFIGTGLDLFCKALTTSNTEWQVKVDGISTGNLPLVANKNQIVKVVSGLPYGTHTVNIVRNAVSSGQIGLTNFVVYGPKKPMLPSSSIELADYNVMADFVSNSAVNIYSISQGVIRKSCTREFVLVEGTGGSTSWTLGFNTAYIDHRQVWSDRLNAYAEYVFFGSGFDLRFEISSSNSTNIAVSLNGVALTAANFPTASFSTYGSGAAFNSATGILDQQDGVAAEGAGFIVSGLPVGKYTLKLNNGTASSFLEFKTLDIITPIHSTKSNFTGALQNTLPVGSQGIADLRKLNPSKEISNTNKYRGIAQGLGDATSTTSTGFVPMKDMSLTVPSKGGWFRITYSATVYSSGASYVLAKIFIDGNAESGTEMHMLGSSDSTISASKLVFLSAGVHKVDLCWRVPASTGNVNNQSHPRLLTVEEL